MLEPVIGKLSSSPVITRCASNPVLKPSDVPYKPTLVFNAGVAKFHGRYVMVFRNDFHLAGGGPGAMDPMRANLGLAFSDDGVHWDVQPRPCWEYRTAEVLRVYDPRLMVIDGRCYVAVAMETRHGICAGLAVTDDFERFEMISTTVPDNRNIVIIPERVGGMYVRLERPFPVYSRGRDRFDIWASDSSDLKYWGNPRLVLGVEDVPFCNDKIGPGAQPIRTDKGWLEIFHSVDRDDRRGKNGWEDLWQKRYTAGVMLLDLDDPARVIGMCRSPLIAPEALYETAGGLRNDVIFPCGAILEDSGEVKIYYGAADTTVCLATAAVDDLLKLCLDGGPVAALGVIRIGSKG